MMKFLRRFNDLGINGLLARWYDKNSREHRIEELKGHAEEVVKHVKDGDAVLEVAPGPGYLSIELAKLGSYRITGLDISRDFVDIALKNAKEPAVDVEFQQGNVSSMPFSDNMFDFIICTAAFKNFKEPLKALGEMYRVLKHRAEALISDMNRNTSNQQLDDAAKEMGVEGIEALFLKLTFKYFLKKGAYTREEFLDLLSKTAFKEYSVKETGISLYVNLRK